MPYTLRFHYDNMNILAMVRNFTDYFAEKNNFLSPASKSEIKKHVHDYYDLIWKESINMLTKSDSYNSFKTMINLEKYTWAVKNVKHRIALSRLRLSCHQLMIEKGRHYRPTLPRPERKCPHCKNAVEDECPLISRNSFFYYRTKIQNY